MLGIDGTRSIGRGSKHGHRYGQDSLGECRCPNCGHRESYKITVPCYSRACPKCGAPMTQA